MKNKRMLASLVSSMLLVTAAHAGSLDPVSSAETAMAKSIANPPVIAARAASTAAADHTSASTSPGVEFLRVEAHRFAKSEVSTDKRWADVTSYDYDSDELITKVVDLNTNTVVSTTRNKEMQPPLADAELTRAISIVFEDPEELSILQNEYQRITGEQLSSIDQLHYKAFTFFADSMPGVVNEASTVCGTQRCAQLVLYTHDNLVFEVSPIVNLSAGVVSQRMGY